MLPKKNTHSEEEDILTLMYAVADAIDVANEIQSPALQRKLQSARLLLQASYGGLIHVARELDKTPPARMAAEAAVS